MRQQARATAGHRPRSGWALALVALVAALGLALLVLPGDLTAKAYLAMHGLCAQRPERTFALGGVPLPVDARMTGLYLGAVVAAGPLLRRRGIGLPWGWLALLLAFVTIMGLDGLNSLRVDLGWAGWWPPDNRLRLLTGYLAGLSLGIALAWLVNLGGRPAATPLLRPRDALVWLAGGLLTGAATLSGAGWALAPLTLALVGGALLTFTALNLSCLLLILSRDGAGQPSVAAAPWPATARPLVLALTLAVGQIALLAAARFALEAWLARPGIM